MYIAFYISSHGFGHMTRCLSIIENILKNSKYNIYMVCGNKQNDFAKVYLSKFKDRIIYKDIIIDIGFINKKNSLEIDKRVLKKKLEKFVLSWDDIVKKECNFLKSLKVKCVVSDISPIGCIIGNKLNIPIKFISNFSWIEQYEYLGLDKWIINRFKEAYSYVNMFIKYDLCLSMISIDNAETYEVGFVCRYINESKVNQIKEQYGDSIFITCGKSASLNRINIRNFRGTIFTTSGIEVICDDKCSVVKLPIDILDTQNYITASEIVIAKAGWGTIAECILGRSNLVLIERPSSKEDSFNIEKIKERKLGISIDENDLAEIDIKEIKEKLINSIDYRKLNSYKNNAGSVANLIISNL
ncbi:MAG: glycosyltransferase [Paeniclostridium sordellii]|nr:glycosyltransferase [Paeniclostridium sordellii]